MALFQSGTYNLAAIADQAPFRWGVAMLPDRADGPGQRHQRHCRRGQFGDQASRRGAAGAGVDGQRPRQRVPRRQRRRHPRRDRRAAGLLHYWAVARRRREPVLQGARRPAHTCARRRRVSPRASRRSSPTSTRCSSAAATWPTSLARRAGRRERRRRALSWCPAPSVPAPARRQHTSDHDRKRHPVGPFRPRRRRRDLTGAAAGGDRIAHLVGPAQRHGDAPRRAGRRPPRPPPAARPPSGRYRVWAAACAPRRARGTRRSASGMPATPSASATAQSSTGIRSGRSGRPSVATAGAISATLVVHDTMRAEPEQHDRQRGDAQEVEQPTQSECRPSPRSMTGLPPANVAVAPPRNSKNHSQRGIDGSAPRGIRASRAVVSTSAATNADRHPARVERQQHADARHDDEFRAGPQSWMTVSPGHRPQQHHRPCAVASPAGAVMTCLPPPSAPSPARRPAGAGCAGTGPPAPRSRGRSR